MDPEKQTLPMHPLIGRTLKHYRFDSLLGQGGMGVVYRCLDTRLDRAVALKILAPDLTADPERRKRFLREARAAARISHPAIAQVYDVDEHDGTTFIAMELVEGRTIRELIQNRELDLLGAIDVAIQIVDGIARAHETGIIHRDIKPANVMLTRDGHVKILDFGLAKLIDPSDTTLPGGAVAADAITVTQTRVGAVMGTAAYMSPEQVKAQPLDARSDLFSLGVMLFEMVTWELPFHRPTMMETMQAVAFDETPSVHSIRPHLPPELQRVLSGCLRKRPEDRYPNARALAQDLRVLRRETESGRVGLRSWRERMVEVSDRFTHLTPAQYAWLAGGALAIAVVTYLLLADVGLGGLIAFSVVSLLLYRYVRNRPQRMLEWFVQKVARIPEVRLIVLEKGHLTVAVDRAVAQLYGRINSQLNQCNRKIFFGQPMTVSIRSDLQPEEIRRLLAGPGVQYVREDVTRGE
jgi:predicted Ser/Thr protein kinase